MNKCGTCKHYTGAGDFDLCCMKSKRRLCYRNDDACDEWEENPIKHTYYVVMDGQVITTLSDRKGIHPVYAISLMGQYLSESIEKANDVYLCGKQRGFGLAHEPNWFCADGERR